MDFPSRYPCPDPFIRQVYVGRVGLLVTLSVLGLSEGLLWIANFLTDAVLPQELLHQGSALEFLVRFFILDVLGLIGAFTAVRLILRRPLRTAITSGRPIRSKFVVQGALIAFCSHLPGYMVLLWAQPIGFGRWLDIVQEGIGLRMLVLFSSELLLYPFQAFTEELMFRGFLTQLFGDAIRNRFVLAVIIALVFALVHGRFSASELADLFAISLLFSAVTFASGGIEWAVGYHAVTNVLISWAAYLLSAVPEDQWRWIGDFLWVHAALHLTVACMIFWHCRRAARHIGAAQGFP